MTPQEFEKKVDEVLDKATPNTWTHDNRSLCELLAEALRGRGFDKGIDKIKDSDYWRA